MNEFRAKLYPFVDQRHSWKKQEAKVQDSYLPASLPFLVFSWARTSLSLRSLRLGSWRAWAKAVVCTCLCWSWPVLVHAYTTVIISTSAPAGLEKQFIAQTTTYFKSSLFVNPLASNTYQIKLFGSNGSPVPTVSGSSFDDCISQGFADGMESERKDDLDIVRGFQTVNSTIQACQFSYNQIGDAIDQRWFQIYTSTGAVVPIPLPVVASTGTITITADDSYSLYLNETLIGADRYWNDAEIYSVTFSTGINVIAIQASNIPSPAGVLVSIQVNGKTYVTGSSWKVSIISSIGWASSGFDDSSWVPATDEGVYGIAPWGTAVNGMNLSTQAHWIWSNDSSQTPIFLRYTMGGL